VDVVSGEVTFNFRKLQATDAVCERWQKLLNIEAEFEISASGRTVLHDELFNVVEFASSVSAWLAHATDDFSFSTMEAEDRDIVFFRRKNAHWLIGSAWGVAEGVDVDGNELRNALLRFLTRLSEECATTLAIDIKDVIAANHL
jgi:hypothetical protein